MALRRFVSESPRWLMVNQRLEEAERVVVAIEARARQRITRVVLEKIVLYPGRRTRWFTIFPVLLRRYPRRTVFGLTLMTAQAFLYNALFFTYALVLTRYYGVAESRVGLFLLPFAAGNFLGPLVLGPLFDLIGRRAMIVATCALTGALILAASPRKRGPSALEPEREPESRASAYPEGAGFPLSRE